MKKPRPFAPLCKLASLQPDQIEQVASWMLDEELTYREAAARVKEVFGFDIHYSSFTHFWKRECLPRKLLRASGAAKSVQDMTAVLKMDWQGVNAQLIGQRIFETLSDPAMDVKTVCALGSILEKVKVRGLHERALKARLATEKRRLQQAEQRMTLAREKFEFDAVEAALAHAPAIRTITADGKLSGDEKRERLRRLLFPQAFEASPA